MSACSKFINLFHHVHFLCPFYNERQKSSLLDYSICSMQKVTVVFRSSLLRLQGYTCHNNPN